MNANYIALVKKRLSCVHLDFRLRGGSDKMVDGDASLFALLDLLSREARLTMGRPVSEEVSGDGRGRNGREWERKVSI